MKFLLFFPFFFVFVAVNAQVSNTQADFSCPGQVTVTYNLNSPQPVDVTLYYSHDKCTWLLAEHVTGDLFNQTTGTGKTIVWDNFADHVSFGKFYFKIEMPPPPTPDCVMINGVCWATSNLDVGGVFCQNPWDYGALYQWGRRTDGHESRTSPCWPLTPPCGNDADGVVSNLDGDGQVPVGPAPYGYFIRELFDPSDWRTPQADTLWNFGTATSPVKTVNDPCPNGWRMPTRVELTTLTQTTYVNNVWITENGINGYRCTDINTGNTLFLPAAGSRGSLNGSHGLVGMGGYYWSSATASAGANHLLFTNGIFLTNYASNRAAGFSVRCVAEN